MSHAPQHPFGSLNTSSHTVRSQEPGLWITSMPNEVLCCGSSKGSDVPSWFPCYELLLDQLFAIYSQALSYPWHCEVGGYVGCAKCTSFWVWRCQGTFPGFGWEASSRVAIIIVTIIFHICWKMAALLKALHSDVACETPHQGNFLWLIM